MAARKNEFFRSFDINLDESGANVPIAAEMVDRVSLDFHPTNAATETNLICKFGNKCARLGGVRIVTKKHYRMPDFSAESPAVWLDAPKTILRR